MHPLELILQLQVGSDQTAVSCLPSIISSLTPAHFEPSPHLQKWTSRLTSLIHSKHPGARWAGLCLALQTSVLNKDVMVEASQSWIAITLPMLSVGLIYLDFSLLCHSLYPVARVTKHRQHGKHAFGFLSFSSRRLSIFLSFRDSWHCQMFPSLALLSSPSRKRVKTVGFGYLSETLTSLCKFSDPKSASIFLL